jgi:hypothetical protein
MASAAADEESSVLKSSAADSIQVWIASFLRYLELRLQLLGREAREAGLHLLIMSLLLVSMLVCFASCLILLPGPFKLAGLPNAPETVARDRYGNHREDQNRFKKKREAVWCPVILKNREE